MNVELVALVCCIMLNYYELQCGGLHSYLYSFNPTLTPTSHCSEFSYPTVFFYDYLYLCVSNN